jgi:ABC-2 type transport system ATP-binding protein
MTESNDAIQVSGLTKIYGARTPAPVLAVDHISFSVRVGETFGFLGPNGAGKTTTIGMLTTLLEPTEGTIAVMGYDARRDPYAVKEQLGIVPEVSNCYDDLSAWDNLIFTARLYGIPRGERDARAAELLKAFGLYEKRHLPTLGFSKGMKRRVTIAMGLIHRPRILLLDEPTSGLDVQSALLIRETMRQLHEAGTTIFLTTHNIEEANQSCQRVAIIHHGKMAAIDSPERLKQAFQSVQAVEVGFNAEGRARRDELARLPGVSAVREQGDKVRLFTESPGALIPHLVEWAQARHLSFTSLNTLGPTLEEVFVKITGLEIAPSGAEDNERAQRGKGRGRGMREEQGQ